jgi:hypothetical protein
MGVPPQPHLIRVRLNPLWHPQFQLITNRKGGAAKASAEELLAMMCGLGVSSHPDAAWERYLAIAEKDAHLTLFPDERALFDLIITPLMNAKAAFMTGSYTATIALSGAVGEALADFVFRIYAPDPEDPRVPKKRKDDLHRFDRAGQSNRITILSALEIARPEATTHLRALNDLRNFYLHPAERTGRSAEQDALIAYEHAVWWASDVVGRDVRDGGWHLGTPMFQYLQKLGVVVEAPPSSDA